MHSVAKYQWSASERVCEGHDIPLILRDGNWSNKSTKIALSCMSPERLKKLAAAALLADDHRAWLN